MYATRSRCRLQPHRARTHLYPPDHLVQLPQPLGFHRTSAMQISPIASEDNTPEQNGMGGLVDMAVMDGFGLALGHTPGLAGTRFAMAFNRSIVQSSRGPKGPLLIMATRPPAGRCRYLFFTELCVSGSSHDQGSAWLGWIAHGSGRSLHHMIVLRPEPPSPWRRRHYITKLTSHHSPSALTARPSARRDETRKQRREAINANACAIHIRIPLPDPYP